MRVLVVEPGPWFSVKDVCDGWVSGLREAGCQVVTFNLGDRLDFYSNALLERFGETRRAFNDEAAAALACKGVEAACYEFWPDVVLVVSGFFLQPAHYELMRQRGHKVVLVHTESPYEDDRQVPRAEHATLNILNDPTNIGRFPPGTVYLPHAYDPARHHPRSAVAGYESEFCFVGTGYPSRVEFFEKVDWSGIDVTLAGNWLATDENSPLRTFLAHPVEQCCPNDTTAELYASTFTSCNLYRREATDTHEGWAIGPREVELAACGTWFAREPRVEGDKIFPMLPTFTTPAELGDVIRWALANPDARAEAVKAARAAVADRTFANNAKRMLALL